MLPGSGLLKSAEEAGELADGIGYPVLLKVGAPGIYVRPMSSSPVAILTFDCYAQMSSSKDS